MKSIRFFAFCASMLLFAGASLFAQQSGSLERSVTTAAGAIETRLPEGSRVAVLGFTVEGRDISLEDTQRFSNYVLDELARIISASGKIQVVDRQHMEAVRRELNIQMQRDVSDSEIRRVGQQLGAQYVVTGSLVDIGTAYRFSIAAIDVESAVRVASSSVTINLSDPQLVFLLTGVRTGTITNVTFSGSRWAEQADGRRISPAIGHNQTTVIRVHFTTTVPNATLVIQLGVSSEPNRDFAFVGHLNAPASGTAYSERISGENTRTITVRVPTAGNHFVEIGYTKDVSVDRGSDAAWFTLEYR